MLSEDPHQIYLFCNLQFKKPPKSDKDGKDKDDKKNDDEEIEYKCGIVNKHVFPDQPSTSPSNSPVPKEFVTKEGVVCNVAKGETRRQKSFTNVESRRCEKKCNARDKCEAYTWIEKKLTCIIYDFRPRKVKKGDETSLCARLPRPTNPPTDQPSDSPTKVPTPPTSPPTDKPVAPLKCTIKAVLGFDFKDPDDAPYYGHHLDWIEVSKKGKTPDYICSAYYHNINDAPGWCTYKNSVEGHDGAHVDNWMDEYYTDAELENELVSEETVRIKDAADHVTAINVYHWLFDKDYYPGDPEWKDHMMAPKLTIYNLSNEKQNKIGGPFQHPVSQYVSTHIEQDDGTWVGNPFYKGNFKLEVHCNRFCRCEVKNYKASNGFDAGRVAEGGTTSSSETDTYRASYAKPPRS